jgi:hypothetical protein
VRQEALETRLHSRYHILARALDEVVQSESDARNGGSLEVLKQRL